MTTVEFRLRLSTPTVQLLVSISLPFHFPFISAAMCACQSGAKGHATVSVYHSFWCHDRNHHLRHRYVRFYYICEDNLALVDLQLIPIISCVMLVLQRSLDVQVTVQACSV